MRNRDGRKKEKENGRKKEKEGRVETEGTRKR